MIGRPSKSGNDVRCERRKRRRKLSRLLTDFHPQTTSSGLRMRNSSRSVTFPGASGAPLAARLDLPTGIAPRAYALFAHCFTCSKDTRAAAFISEALADAGIATLRFDFTGLGGSGGDFANTSFSSNVGDLVAAADWLRRDFAAPAILVGHSLGGAAVLAAAPRIPEAVAVATINAPADPAHVTRLFAGKRAEIEACRRSAGRTRRTDVPDSARVPRGHRSAEAFRNHRRTLPRAHRVPRAARHDGWDRERLGDLHRGEASEELRVARRRRSPAHAPWRCGVCRDRARRLGVALSVTRGSACVNPTGHAMSCRCARRGWERFSRRSRSGRTG